LFDQQFKDWQTDIERIVKETFKNKSDNYNEIEMVASFYMALTMFETGKYKIFSDKMNFNRDVSSLMSKLYK